MNPFADHYDPDEALTRIRLKGLKLFLEYFAAVESNKRWAKFIGEMQAINGTLEAHAPLGTSVDTERRLVTEAFCRHIPLPKAVYWLVVSGTAKQRATSLVMWISVAYDGADGERRRLGDWCTLHCTFAADITSYQILEGFTLQ